MTAGDSSARGGEPPEPPASVTTVPAAWGVLVYLAGDTSWGAQALQDDLNEILAAGGSKDLQIVVQHDGPAGAHRYIVPPSPGEAEVIDLGKVDSGRTTALLDFLRWGMTICQGERLALVFGSPEPQAPNEASPGAMVLSLTHDHGSGNRLGISELADVLREALTDAERKRIDILAIDACYVQFLELAYELEDIVRILIAPQTPVPESGWDYERVLPKWKELVARTPAPGVLQVASELLETISECYAKDAGVRAVSALDLQRLDDVAHAFDTLCIGTMQVLGEGIVWKARKVFLKHMRETTSGPVYDCASFFALWAATLDAVADQARQGWMGTSLYRMPEASLDRFCESMARHLLVPSEVLLGFAKKQIAELEAEAGEEPADLDAQAVTTEAAEQLLELVAFLRAGDRKHAAERLLGHLEVDITRQVRLIQPGGAAAQRAHARSVTRTAEAVVHAAIDRAAPLLPDERLFDLRRMEEAAENARRLARQADQARIAVVGDGRSGATGMVLAVRTTPAGPRGPVGWPRWSGVSIYRPANLAELMNDAYQRFAFCRRVHWAAMLGAANLIEEHPRALWRLVSSLLATGAAVTRRDVLRRLSGSDSVIWGLRDQFQVMAPAPTLTLSLERRASSGTVASRQAASDRYLLRLESITRGAVVTEQDSRVQPKMLDRALDELNALLNQSVITGQSLNELRGIGGLLGEDIFQTLGRTLEDERMSVLAESPDLTPHLQLQIPLELMRYPWELLHHRGDWLGERFAMGRQVFMETGLARRVPARRQGCVRPLIIGDPVFDAGQPYPQLPGARDEAEQVAGWFERAAAEVGSIIDFNRERDTRIHRRVTTAELRSLLRDGLYDIVHFAGHGVFHPDDPETSAWLLSDGQLWALEIRNTLADHPAPPWLVFANACEAGMDGVRPAGKYQGNVFGLATAFINQGVAAYIAPLWPIDDMLAQHMALAFYEQLLSERATLGEALRRAKASARALAYPPRDRDRSFAADSAWAGLGWASLVMYGDPTEELFQALAGGSHRSHRDRASVTRGDEISAPAQTTRKPLPLAARANGAAAQPSSPVLHAPDHQVVKWVQGPNWRPITGQRRDAGAENGVVLELIEDAGGRRWRMAGAGRRGAAAASDGLPGSRISALLADDRVRERLPARRGGMRVIGRWVLSGFDDGAAGLAKEYDREQMKDERLLMAAGESSSQLLPARVHGAPPGVTSDRALLLIHGTFSKTASPVDGLGGDFMAWARRNYRVVLGLDHWTLSKDPEANAQFLENELRALDPGLLSRGKLDIISHSRGGLVARSFCDLLRQADAVRHLIFVGTPNCGTDLANPDNWATFADLLVNMTGVSGAEVFGRMAGLLAQLAATNLVADVPGLLAQSPAAADTSSSFLRRLQAAKADGGTTRYGVICSEFEPTTLAPNLKKLVEAAGASAADTAIDALFKSANDLVVNTANVWGIGRSLQDISDGVTTLPSCVSPSRVLLYVPPKTAFKPPDKIAMEIALGVHHCNLFSQATARETMKRWLMEA